MEGSWLAVLRGELAMSHPVADIDRDADDRPDDEARPCQRGESDHEIEACRHAQEWDEGHEGQAKRAWVIRLRIAEQHHAEADQYEGEEGSDVGHVGRIADPKQ